MPDELFPEERSRRSAIRHILLHGMKGYNGVAILSRLPFWRRGSATGARERLPARPSCELPGGIELHNIYVPAGGDMPDPRPTRNSPTSCSSSTS